jgi:glycosyltransferase involved in cell wall biosynthesis
VSVQKAVVSADRVNPAQDCAPLPAPITSRPSVSVVIATRNRPELLAEALASVAGQVYDGVIEAVVVFDQSEPDPAIARDDRLRPVRVTTSRPGRIGLAAARNIGAGRASGEYLAFLDDDDAWEPAKIERQIAELARSGRTVCVTGITIDREGKRTVRVPSPGDLTVASLIERRVVEAHPSSVLVSRQSFYGAIGEVDEAIPGSYGEDYDWLIRAARHGEIALVAEPLVTVRWGKQSYFAGRWQTIIDANDYLIAKHPEFADSKVGLSRLHGRKAISLVALHRHREARTWALRALRLNPRDRRGYLALLLSTHLVSVDFAMRMANRTGRGL